LEDLRNVTEFGCCGFCGFKFFYYFFFGGRRVTYSCSFNDSINKKFLTRLNPNQDVHPSFIGSSHQYNITYCLVFDFLSFQLCDTTLNIYAILYVLYVWWVTMIEITFQVYLKIYGKETLYGRRTVSSTKNSLGEIWSELSSKTPKYFHL
jgi:hypothetical protein